MVACRTRLRRGVERWLSGCCWAPGFRSLWACTGECMSRPMKGLPSFGFSSTATFKAWVGSVVLALAAAQAVTALWLYGRLPGVTGAPRWLGRVHRTTGFVAFALSLPVAAYCLYGFGFAPAPLSARTLVHSIAGCAFYGAFAAKVLFVHTRGISRWALPAAGALLLTAVVVAWLTSALWLFSVAGLHL